MDVEEDRRGIIPRGRKFVVNMRLPGGKKTWIAVDKINSAKRIVEIIDLYVAGFKALPDDHPDFPGLLEEFRSMEFKHVLLQALESETNYLQQGAGVIQSTAAVVPEDSVHRLDGDRGKTEEPPMPTDAPEFSSVCFACGGRGAVLVQDPRSPPRQTQPGVDPGHLADAIGRLIMAEERNHQKEMSGLRRLTMAKERKHEEKLAKWRRLWRMCRAQEQRCATQGQLALKTLKEEQHWKHFELVIPVPWAKRATTDALQGLIQYQAQRTYQAHMGVVPTYGSTEHDTSIQASIPCEVHEPFDAIGVTPLLNGEGLAMLDDFILDFFGA